MMSRFLYINRGLPCLLTPFNHLIRRERGIDLQIHVFEQWGHLETQAGAQAKSLERYGTRRPAQMLL